MWANAILLLLLPSALYRPKAHKSRQSCSWQLLRQICRNSCVQYWQRGNKTQKSWQRWRSTLLLQRYTNSHVARERKTSSQEWWLAIVHRCSRWPECERYRQPTVYNRNLVRRVNGMSTERFCLHTLGLDGIDVRWGLRLSGYKWRMHWSYLRKGRQASVKSCWLSQKNNANTQKRN